jgi:hypothetical protein
MLSGVPAYAGAIDIVREGQLASDGSFGDSGVRTPLVRAIRTEVRRAECGVKLQKTSSLITYLAWAHRRGKVLEVHVVLQSCFASSYVWVTIMKFQLGNPNVPRKTAAVSSVECSSQRGKNSWGPPLPLTILCKHRVPSPVPTRGAPRWSRATGSVNR